MNNESAVQFETNSRIHMGLAVKDLNSKELLPYRRDALRDKRADDCLGVPV
jgi:hypothetical protein